jgi:hypothetical protein
MRCLITAIGNNMILASNSLGPGGFVGNARGTASVLGFLPFLIPPLYLAIIFLLQPGDRLDSFSGFPPRRHRLLYDDYDLAAYALRGLNASLGRLPGGTAHPPELTAEAFSQALSSPASSDAATRPYFLEYPVPAVWMFRLGFLVSPTMEPKRVPWGLLEGWHNNVVEHRPQDANQRAIWVAFRRAIRVYQMIGIASLLALMVIVHCGYEAGGKLAGNLALFILPGVLYFSANRFDAVPALLVALSLALLGRDQLVLSGLFLASATMLKIYPCLLAPLVLRYLGGRRSDRTKWLTAFLLTILLFMGLALWQVGWKGTLAPLAYQFARSEDSFGLTLYGHVLPSSLAANTWLGRGSRLAMVALSLSLLIGPALVDMTSLLTRSAIAILVFATVQTFYSPQWILWVIPLLVPLTRILPLIMMLTVALDLVTYLTFPVVCDLLGNPHWASWLTELLYLRLVVVGILIGTLGIWEFRKLRRSVVAPA